MDDNDQTFPKTVMLCATGSTPFRLNLHEADVGHTLIVGATGGGKTVWLEQQAALVEGNKGDPKAGS